MHRVVGDRTRALEGALTVAGLCRDLTGFATTQRLVSGTVSRHPSSLVWWSAPPSEVERQVGGDRHLGWEHLGDGPECLLADRGGQLVVRGDRR